MKFVNNASDTGILGLRRHVFDTLQSIEYAEVKYLMDSKPWLTEPILILQQFSNWIYSDDSYLEFYSIKFTFIPIY